MNCYDFPNDSKVKALGIMEQGRWIHRPHHISNRERMMLYLLFWSKSSTRKEYSLELFQTKR